ncbi:MAG: hypothetical protein ACD_39C01224G0001, partial [uncultured bacterium]
MSRFADCILVRRFNRQNFLLLLTVLQLFLTIRCQGAALSGNISDKMLADARSYIGKGEIARAAQEYRKLLEQSPEHIQGRAELAKVLFWQGQRAEAIRLFSQLEFEKITAEERRAFIELLIAEGNFSRAISLATAHLQIQSDDDATRLKLAEMLIWTQHYAEGMAHLEQLQRQNFMPGKISLRKGQALFWSGKPALALPELAKVTEPGSDRAELFLTRGEVFMALASFSQAIEEFLRAEETLGDSARSADQATDPNSLINKALKNRALCYSYLGDNLKAEPALQACYERFPDQVDVIIELSRVLRRTDKIDQALTLLSEASTRMPDRADILFEIADCHIKTGHWHKTRDFYLKGKALASASTEIDLRWANRLAQIRNFPQAAEIISRVLPAVDNQTALNTELAWVMASMERYEEASGILLEILAAEPLNHQATLALARVRILEKKYAAAGELASQVLQKHPANNEAQQIISQVETARQPRDLDYRESRLERIETLQLQLDKDPENFPVAFELTQKLANEKEFDHALGVLEQLLCLYPDHYAAALMQARILGWSREFFCALCAYEKLTHNDCENPVYYREAGRTAFWANTVKQASCWYRPILEIPVATELYEKIAPQAASSTLLSAELARLNAKSRKPAFARFENFASWYAG